MDKSSLRLDHTINMKNRVSVLFLKGRMLPGSAPTELRGCRCRSTVGAVTTTRSTSLRASVDRTIAPIIINAFRGSYQQESGIGIMLTADEKYKFNELLKIPGVPGPDRGLPQLTFTAYNGWGGAFWGGDAGGNFNLSDDITIVRNKHTFKTGFFYSHDRWNGHGRHRPNGAFGFSYLATGLPGDTSQNTGNALASFLLGYASTGGLETPRLVRQLWNYMGRYFQDDWRVRPNLTINIGFRYECTIPIRGGAYTGLKSREDLSTGQIDNFTNLGPTAPNPKAGGRPGALVFSGAGTGRLQDDVFDGYPWALGPRLGIFWRAGRGFVVRASGGRMFASVKTSGGSTHLDGFILNTNYSSADNSINDFFTALDASIPWSSKGLPPSAAGRPFIDPSLNNDGNVHLWQRSDSGRPPTYDNWTLDLQKELTSSMSLTVGYSGSKGAHLPSKLVRLNQIPMDYLTKYGCTLLNSSMNSAGGAHRPACAQPVSAVCQRADQWGHQFSLNRPLNLLLGGWTVSSFLSYESGIPDTVASGASPIGAGSCVFITSYENWRAKAAGEKFDPNKDLWWDNSVFNQGITQAILDSQFGNATRDNPRLRTCWNLNENVSLGRTFRFTERFSFDLRGEVFNALNRVRWGNANNGDDGQHASSHANRHETVFLIWGSRCESCVPLFLAA